MVKWRLNMNLSGIEVFLTIVETQNLSNTAQKLFLSQSTVSHRLNSLEEELDAKLVNRNQGQRYITLTPKGEEFVTIAKRWMSLQKDTEVWKKKEPKIQLNVGLVDSLGTYVFPPFFSSILEKEPTFSLKISSHWAVKICNLLESNDIDIGLVSRLIKSNEILSEPIFYEEMVLVSSSLHSKYGDLIHPNELDVSKELILDWGEDFQLWHNKWWNPENIQDLTVDTVGLIFNLIHIPNSWAIVPMGVAHYFIDKQQKPIKISALTDPPPNRIIYKIINRYTKPSRRDPLHVFERYLDDFIKEIPYFKEI